MSEPGLMIPPPSPRQPGAGSAPATGLDPLSDRFVAIWRKLDASPLRPVWPFLLGAGIAGLAVLIIPSWYIAAGVSLAVVLGIGWFGISVARRLEELDRFSDS